VALVSFDLDGVLQQNPFQGSRPDGVFGHIKRELAPHVPEMADPEAAASAALRMVLGEHQERLSSGRMVDSFDWDGIVDTVARRLGYPGKIDVAGLVPTYAENPELCWAFDGVTECLQALTDAGHTLITVTNGFRCYQEPVLRQLGILQFFRAMVTPELAGAAKPETGIFRAAEQYAGAPRIHVGDTLPHDMAGARRAGWLSIYINQPKAPAYAELPHELAALPPWERPAVAHDWLLPVLQQQRKWHSHPPAELEECMPDAIVSSLSEIPATVARLAG
jgi:putative hydrolase of the HAD superfamily